MFAVTLIVLVNFAFILGVLLIITQNAWLLELVLDDDNDMQMEILIGIVAPIISMNYFAVKGLIKIAHVFAETPIDNEFEGVQIPYSESTKRSSTGRNK